LVAAGEADATEELLDGTAAREDSVAVVAHVGCRLAVAPRAGEVPAGALQGCHQVIINTAR
jgi:hypothetical protein